MSSTNEKKENYFVILKAGTQKAKLD